MHDKAKEWDSTHPVPQFSRAEANRRRSGKPWLAAGLTRAQYYHRGGKSTPIVEAVSDPGLPQGRPCDRCGLPVPVGFIHGSCALEELSEFQASATGGGSTVRTYSWSVGGVTKKEADRSPRFTGMEGRSIMRPRGPRPGSRTF